MPNISNPICRKCGSQRVFQKGRYRCRVCLTRTQAERKARLSPAQRIADARRANDLKNARRASDPEWREREYDRIRQWRIESRESYLSGSRRWYADNVEHSRAKKLAEYRANPEPFKARNHLRKARLLEAVCEHGPECVTAEFLTALYSSACVYCGAPAVEADHFFPLSRGGLNCVENLVPACFSCNRSKHAHDPFVWMASRI